METKKATLKVNGYTFYVNYLGATTHGTCRVALDWDDPRMGFTEVLQEFEFDAFIKCIGFPSVRWHYSEDAQEVFYVSSYGITLVEPEEAEATPPVREESELAPLQAHVQALLDSYEDMEYEITNVQDSLGDKYGKVIIQFKKKEEV